MPYNTRRKSLSLPSLGITLPHGSRAANRSPPAMTSPETHATEQPQNMPPAKKVKRSHTSSASPSPTSPSRVATANFEAEATKSSARIANTPPPSPGDVGAHKIDTQGIDDEIVVAVIEQLEKTGNKPHLLKELAAVLCTQLPIVERYVPATNPRHLRTRSQLSTCDAHALNGKIPVANTLRSSANQSAIISSRLTTYLRRPWSALAPCPVGKQLIGTHPKRIYFYLTTCPHQDFPDPDAVNAAQAQQRQQASRIISPSLSSKAGSAAGDDDEQAERQLRAREQLSPSPELELDLSMHDDTLDSDPLTGDNDTSFDMDADPDVNSLNRTYSGRGSLSRDGTHPPTGENMAHNRRAVSPPLEGDEREFTRTASELQVQMARKRAEEKEERERRASRELSLASGSASANSNGPSTPTSANGSPDSDDIDVKMESGSNPDVDDETSFITVEESEEVCALRNHEAAAALFGNGLEMGMLSIANSHAIAPKMQFASSPLVKPTMHVNVPAVTRDDKDKNVKWTEMMDLQSPETVELDELDDLMESF